MPRVPRPDPPRATPAADPEVARAAESRLEDAARGFVARLRLRGLSVPTIVAAVRADERFGFGDVRTRRLLRECLEGFRDDARANGDFSRGEQIARVRDELSVLLEPRFKVTRRRVPDPEHPKKTKEVEERERLVPPAGAIARLEELLADLEGNRVPLKVHVEHEIGGTAAVVFANMSDERGLALLERARERKRLAELAAPRLIGGRSAG